MKLFAVVVLAALLAGCQGSGSKKVTLQDQKDKVSYTIGVNIGKNLSRDSIAFNPEAVLQGMRDAALDSSQRLLTEGQMQETMQAFQQEMRTKAESGMKALAEKNKGEGERFLAENKGKDGVVTLPSGLQYKVLKTGNGPIPRESQTVTINYRGTLIDGTEFDSSIKRGQPVTFPVKGVIPGWTEALTHMKTGSTWRVWVPSQLAYGEQGVGQVIGPNSTLVFDLELLSVR